MADQNNVEIKDIATAQAKSTNAVIDAAAAPAKQILKDVAKAAKATKPAARRTTRKTAAAKRITKAATKRTAKPARKTAARKAGATRKINAVRTVAAAEQGIETMTKTSKNTFQAFDTIPAFSPFQSIFAQFGERGQDAAKKSQKVSEEFADLARANVEAMVEAGRVAVEGVRSISHNMVATGRDGVEQTAGAIRSFAEAKSPTEYLQIQGEFARASFDRVVAESSKLTESMVKLAGEAFQPISNRASANAQRFNNFVA